MKKVIVLWLLFIVSSYSNFALKAQNVQMDSTKTHVLYMEVVQMPGITKAKLYERAMNAINVMYKQAKNKIDVQDPEQGLLKLKCTCSVVLEDHKTKLMVQSGFIKYKLNLYFKEGKYKYEFTDFHTDMGGFPEPIEKQLPENAPDPKRRSPERLAFLDKDIRNLIKILKENMAGEKVEKKQDW